MKFHAHYSSSKHNLYEVVADNGKRLLIECGLPWGKMQEALGFDLGGIEACLCSHSHLDHSKAMADVMRAGIDCYASVDTFEALCLTRNRKAIIVGDEVLIRSLPSFEVLCFGVTHDVPCLGFVVREKATGEYLLFATDFFCLEQEFVHPFSIVAIACSYDMHVLQARVAAGDIDETLAKRLLTSHPSKQWLMGYLAGHVDLSVCREIVLLHMSGSNLNKEATRREIQQETFIPVRV